MPRRFNYTGRQKIRRTDASIRIVGAGAALGFDADLALKSYELDPKARVAVEAYRSRTASYRRFEFGFANAPVPPADRSLADFHDADNILFRVKVTLEQDGLGKLLAEADGINPRLPDEVDDSAKSLLSVTCYPLDGEVWRIDFPPAGDAPPVLAIDSKVPLRHQYAADPAFRSIAIPAALRQILTRILIAMELDEEPNPDHWTAQWLTFARTLTGSAPPSDPDDEEACEKWIDEAVGAFARRGRFLDLILAQSTA